MDAHVCPHFPRVYVERDCTALASKVRALLPPDRVPTRYNHVCLMELFDCNLTSFLRALAEDPPTRLDDLLRVVVFQVLYTLLALQVAIPGFRHNDCSTHNVLVKRLGTTEHASYAALGTAWHTASPVHVALFDFDFAWSPSPYHKLQNERVRSGRYNIRRRRNSTYDAHFFLKSLRRCLRDVGLRSHAPKTAAFLRSLPMRADYRVERCIPQLHLQHLLSHRYFDSLVASNHEQASSAAAYAIPFGDHHATMM